LRRRRLHRVRRLGGLSIGGAFKKGRSAPGVGTAPGVDGGQRGQGGTCLVPPHAVASREVPDKAPAQKGLRGRAGGLGMVTDDGPWKLGRRGGREPSAVKNRQPSFAAWRAGAGRASVEGTVQKLPAGGNSDNTSSRFPRDQSSSDAMNEAILSWKMAAIIRATEHAPRFLSASDRGGRRAWLVRTRRGGGPPAWASRANLPRSDKKTTHFTLGSTGRGKWDAGGRFGLRPRASASGRYRARGVLQQAYVGRA